MSHAAATNVLLNALTFSRRFQRTRALMLAGRRWQLACYDRIPSGLFDAEVRTRTFEIPTNGWLVQVELVAPSALEALGRLQSRFVAVGILLTALAMVSKLPYTHAMNRYLRGKANVGTIAMYVIVALLLLIYPQWTLAIAFTGYALTAPMWWAYKRVVGKH